MFPELIKLMAVNDMSHKQLGEIFGVSQQATTLKIKGVHEFKRSEMQKIKEYFLKIYPGVTMDNLFTTEIFLQ